MFESSVLSQMLGPKRYEVMRVEKLTYCGAVYNMGPFFCQHGI